MKFLRCEEMFSSPYPASTKGQHSVTFSYLIFFLNLRVSFSDKRSWGVLPSLYFHSEAELSGPSPLCIDSSQLHPTMYDSSWGYKETFREVSKQNLSDVREWEI